MIESTVIPFKSPETLEVTLKRSKGSPVSGMGIPKGITLVVGGGYHGKSTLLNALQLGIYNHIPGDGRELCVSNGKSIKIRATSGRNVEKVDISTFIKNLPHQQDTNAFSTENASGSTSQAASIMEMVEMGAEVMLMDEDTCATNFMIRDHKMQQLVHKDDEPITTYIDRARQLHDTIGISSILVLGGSGDYFDISDTVIQMKNYEPIDVSSAAKNISLSAPVQRIPEDEDHPMIPTTRIPLPRSIDPTNQYNKVSFFSKEVFRIHFGKTIIELSDVEQLMELSQTKAIAQAILLIKDYADGRTPLKNIIHRIMNDLDEKGLDVLSQKISGHFARFRGLELAAVLNRLRGLEVRQILDNS
jgi:predicted ABC-class ATPase